MAVNRADYELIEEGIYRHKENTKKFFFRVYIPDTKLEKKKIFEVKDKTKASEILNDARVAFFNFKKSIFDDSGSKKLNDGITLDELYKRYRDAIDMSKDWQKKKLKDYELYIKAALGNKKIRNISNADIEKIKTQMAARGLAPRTRKTINEIFSPLFTFAQKNGYIAKGCAPEIDAVKIPSQKKVVTSASDKVVILYKTIMSAYADNPMYRAMFLIWLLLAKRKTETLKMKWQQIDFENNYIWLTSDSTKSAQNQRFFLPPEIKEALLEFREQSGYIFKNYNTGEHLANMSKQVIKIKELSGIKEFTPHYCRNLLASAAHDAGVAASNLSGALGHSDANTINKYLTINYYDGSQKSYEALRQILDIK